MKTKKIYWDDLGVTAEISEYTPLEKLENII